MNQSFDCLKQEIDATRKALISVFNLLEKINQAVEEGFKNVNHRLFEIEGNNGMIGVNKQLEEIKLELQNIQKIYPYHDQIQNLKDIRGEA